jgi:hypothetical protein
MLVGTARTYSKDGDPGIVRRVGSVEGERKEGKEGVEGEELLRRVVKSNANTPPLGKQEDGTEVKADEEEEEVEGFEERGEEKRKRVDPTNESDWMVEGHTLSWIN